MNTKFSHDFDGTAFLYIDLISLFHCYFTLFLNLYDAF